MNHPPFRPEVSDRVAALHARMTLEEKLAQIVGYWVDQGDGIVAPMQGEMSGDAPSQVLAEVTEHGIGHYTRVYGTRPVDPAERARWLWDEQRRLMRETRLGIPAIVHEECLTGVAAWQATTFPTPLAWGAAFDPDLVAEMGRAIGESMASLGVHQGLAPVLDVIRDPRWGRVEECISEDPYVVGTIGTAYVRGMQEAGVHATLKHFLGYSGSTAGRNHAPLQAGPRELADVFLPPFEMALLDGGAKSVMNSYAEIDGVPVAATPEYLTNLLRGELGFTGVVVADYFAVGFLDVMHAVAADLEEAAHLGLVAGIDVELPNGDAYLAPLARRIRSGVLDEAFVDRAVLRVLRQKEELGLLDADAYAGEPPTSIDLDPPRHRELARALAERSVVLLSNDGILPLGGGRSPARIAVIGPNADRSRALQGCYSFANHVLPHHPDSPTGLEVPTVLDALRSVLGASSSSPTLLFAQGCDVEGEDESGFDDAVRAARSADVAVVVVGDQAGLFGRGTVGEGNDVESLELPGVQRRLVETIVATGVPVVMVLVTGRPYAIGWALDGDRAPSAVVQTFFPGECGGLAIADVLTGAVNPSGRLPISLPRSAGAQPYTYLHPILGGPSDVTAADSTPVRPFGFGLSYTTFEHTDLEVSAEVEAGGEFFAAVTVTNTGDRRGSDVVQLYGHDVRSSVTQPLVRLLAYVRVELGPGESRRVTFNVPTTRFAFTGRRLVRIVEPGETEVWVGSHAGASARSTEVSLGTGGAITSARARSTSDVPGSATKRASVMIIGGPHVVTPADARTASVQLSAP